MSDSTKGKTTSAREILRRRVYDGREDRIAEREQTAREMAAAEGEAESDETIFPPAANAEPRALIPPPMCKTCGQPLEHGRCPIRCGEYEMPFPPAPVAAPESSDRHAAPAEAEPLTINVEASQFPGWWKVEVSADDGRFTPNDFTDMPIRTSGTIIFDGENAEGSARDAAAQLRFSLAPLVKQLAATRARLAEAEAEVARLREALEAYQPKLGASIADCGDEHLPVINVAVAAPQPTTEGRELLSPEEIKAANDACRKGVSGGLEL